MKMSSLVGRRTKENPKDAELTSHKFLLRGGYIKQQSSGIFSMLPLAKRVVHKIERIIREEMDGIEGQEVTMPVVMPATIWKESGRYDAVDNTMVRFDDRTGAPCVLGMTHEEAVVHMVRGDVTSYKQLPLMLYQIQTKFRDEPRSRGGLIRVREFTMKDAYSFHASQECLEDYYQKCFEAYERIYARCGLTNVISVESDTGMMGGSVAHEFMYINDCGEDTLVLGEDSSYKANKEVALTRYEYPAETLQELEEVYTPGHSTIEQVAEFLSMDQTKTCKIVLLENLTDNKLVTILVRGDREINEIAVRKALSGAEVKFAEEDLILSAGIYPGYGSLIGVDLDNLHVLIDESVIGNANLVVGANKKDYHIKNWNFERDLNKGLIGQFSFVQEGDLDPTGVGPIRLSRGVEVGNIFQLGTKYSNAMGASYLDDNGKAQDFIMGCYGIGVGRLLACLIEEHHDEYGPIWPLATAPFQVHICMLDKKKENIEALGWQIYKDLQNLGIEVLIDDRNEKAGFQFADADLIGAPFRIVLSAKTVKQGQFELGTRGVKDKSLFDLKDLKEVLLNRLNSAQ